MKTELDRLIWLYNERQKVPATPHMSFNHGYHGCETIESYQRFFEYNIRYRQWQIVNQEYYDCLKDIYRCYIKESNSAVLRIYSVQFANHLNFRIKYGKDIPLELLITLKGLYERLRRIC